jgi:two-component sensor histidine kinase
LGANALTLLALGLQWTAIRIAEGRRPRPWLLVPAALWTLACAVPEFHATYSLRVVLASILIAALDAANVAEFARPHAESVPSRRLAITAYGFHCALYATRAGMILASDPGLGAADPSQLSARVNLALELCLYYTALLHPAVASLVLLTMAKERAEAALLRAQRDRAQLMRELNHRVKNILATVQGMALQTARQSGGDMGRYHAAYLERLRALARAHDLLNERAWRAVPAREAVEAALAPWLGDDRIAMLGNPAGQLAPAQSQALMLALHELATNAARHGALSCPEGRVALTLVHDQTVDGTETLRLHWKEFGGPPIAAVPSHHGFGRRLLERGLAHQLGATVRYEFRPEGVSCEITLPLWPGDEEGAGATILFAVGP